MNSYSLLTPEIIVAVFAAAVILLDLVVREKALLAALSVVGLLASLGVSVTMWGRENNELFDGMLKVDQLAIFFNF
ncbi:unnamed protein product, partial [marine sediment metagenome]